MSTLWRAARLFLVIGLVFAAWRFVPQALPPRLSLSLGGQNAARLTGKQSGSDVAPSLPGMSPVASSGESGSLGLADTDPEAVPALAWGIGGGGGNGGSGIPRAGVAGAGAAPRTDSVSRASADRISYLWPSQGEITSYFGPREDEFHTGIDIAAFTGEAVRAARAGVVVESGWRGGYGLAVVIDHGDGVQTLYGHNSQAEVDIGDHVDAGQLIALAGSTGHSTGPHVHFEILIRGFPVNPLPWMEP